MISVWPANNEKVPMVVEPLLSDATVTTLPELLLLFTKRTAVASLKLVAAPTVFGTVICVAYTLINMIL